MFPKIFDYSQDIPKISILHQLSKNSKNLDFVKIFEKSQYHSNFSKRIIILANIYQTSRF